MDLVLLAFFIYILWCFPFRKCGRVGIVTGKSLIANIKNTTQNTLYISLLAFCCLLILLILVLILEQWPLHCSFLFNAPL